MDRKIKEKYDFVNLFGNIHLLNNKSHKKPITFIKFREKSKL